MRFNLCYTLGADRDGDGQLRESFGKTSNRRISKRANELILSGSVERPGWFRTRVIRWRHMCSVTFLMPSSGRSTRNDWCRFSSSFLSHGSGHEIRKAGFTGKETTGELVSTAGLYQLKYDGDS